MKVVGTLMAFHKAGSWLFHDSNAKSECEIVLSKRVAAYLENAERPFKLDRFVIEAKDEGVKGLSGRL